MVLDIYDVLIDTTAWNQKLGAGGRFLLMMKRWACDLSGAEPEQKRLEYILGRYHTEEEVSAAVDVMQALPRDAFHSDISRDWFDQYHPSRWTFFVKEINPWRNACPYCGLRHV